MAKKVAVKQIRLAKIAVCSDCMAGAFGLPDHMKLIDVRFDYSSDVVELYFQSPFAPVMQRNMVKRVHPVYDEDGTLLEIRGMDT